MPKKINILDRSPENLAKIRKEMPFRPCAGVALFNKEGKIWLGQRKSNAETQGSKLWQLPQGGIDKGEKRLAAAKRELWEETGVTDAIVIENVEGWLKYELPDELLGIGLKKKYRGQKQAWFAFLFTGDDSQINISEPPDGAPVEFDAWRWADLSEITEKIVDFKRPLYAELQVKFADIPEAIKAGKFNQA